VGFYLHVLVWHAIRGGANLFRLAPPDPMPPFSSLGMDIKSGSPWSFFVGVPHALIVFLHPNCFEVRNVINIYISFGLHNVRFN
jgi:hypothetical protein